MQLEHKEIPFDLKAAQNGMGFCGYGSTWHNMDSYGDIIAPGAFKDGLPYFLKKGVILYQHAIRQPIGKPKSAKEDDHGLYLEASISDTELGREVRTLIGDDVIQSLSIGFVPNGVKWMDTCEEVEKYWQSVGYKPSDEDMAGAKYGGRLLTAIKLYEISPVTFPANGLCDITAVKEAGAGCRSFADHSEMVLAAVEEFVKRAEQLGELRAADDRPLSGSARRRLKQLQAQIDALLATKEGPADELRALQAQFHRTHSQYNLTVLGLG